MTTLDFSFLQIIAAIPLQKPAQPLTAEMFGPMRHQFFALTLVSAHRLLDAVALASHGFGGQRMRDIVPQLVARHAFAALGLSSLSVCMAVAGPHALLIAHGKWFWYALAAPRVFGSLHTYTNASLLAPDMLRFDVPRRRHREQQDVDVIPRALQADAQSMSLRDIAAGIRSALADKTLGRADALRFARMVAWVEQMHGEARGDTRSENTHVISRTWQWRIAYLLKHVMLSMEVKHTGDFAKVLRVSLATILPAVWADTFLHMLDVVDRPKRSTLYLHRLTLHVGFCCTAGSSGPSTSQTSYSPT